MNEAEAVVARLRERGWTLAVAESLTGGGVASRVVAVPGASSVLLGGVVAYATAIKHLLLDVDAPLLAERGAVHPEVARQMAEGVRRALAVDGRPATVGVATTGIAGPDSPDGQPVGTVHVAAVTPHGLIVRSHRFDGSRDRIRAQAEDAALGVVLAALDAERE